MTGYLFNRIRHQIAIEYLKQHSDRLVSRVHHVIDADNDLHRHDADRLIELGEDIILAGHIILSYVQEKSGMTSREAGNVTARQRTKLIDRAKRVDVTTVPDEGSFHVLVDGDIIVWDSKAKDWVLAEIDDKRSRRRAR